MSISTNARAHAVELREELNKAIRVKGMIPLAVSAVLMLAACTDYRGMPVNGYRRWQDRLSIIFGLADAHVTTPCNVRFNSPYGLYWAPLRTDQCFRMDPPQRWNLIWRVSKREGYCVGKSLHEQHDCRSIVEITTPELSRATKRPMSRHMLDSGVYSVDFIGRRSSVAARAGHVYTVQEVIALNKIGDVPKSEELPKNGRVWDN